MVVCPNAYLEYKILSHKPNFGLMGFEFDNFVKEVSGAVEIYCPTHQRH